MFPARSSFYHLLTPKGGAKSVRRAKKSGNGRRLAPKTLRGRARARVFDGASAARSSSRLSAMRSLLCASRNNDLLRFEFLSSHLAGFRPAGSHCENSGSSDGSGASARSDRAQTAQILRDRSASAGGGTRCFSQCLIFWCFWIKTKARKKESKRIFFRSILRETILPLRLCVSCKERIYHLLSPKGGAKSVRQAKSCGKLTAPR